MYMSSFKREITQKRSEGSLVTHGMSYIASWTVKNRPLKDDLAGKFFKLVGLHTAP